MSHAVDTQPTADKSSGEHSPRKKSGLGRILAPVILALIGIAVLLYPVVITQLTNLEQHRVAQSYTKEERDVSGEKLAAQMKRAREYNENRTTGLILDPWLPRVSEDNEEYQEYLSQLNALSVMARLVVPTANVDLPVYHGTSDATLHKEVGHLYGSDLPVGGMDTHSVLTAHSGLTNATLFDNLHKVKKGDAIYVGVSGERLKYEVDDIQTVLPHETDGLKPQVGKDLITLVTCTPYGINTHRLLVTGHRVPMDPEDEAAFSEGGMNWQWWMIVSLIAVVVFLIGFIWWALRQRKKQQAAAEEEMDI